MQLRARVREIRIHLRKTDVAAAQRRRGIGRALLNAALEWAREQGATRAQLLADLDNAAGLAFYRRLGWRGTRLCAQRFLFTK